MMNQRFINMKLKYKLKNEKVDSQIKASNTVKNILS